ncbi:SRPBCC family protein [Paenarthrobacter sp. NPDC090522]|uniref:SRPBCC family protein n=1 Tax=Paenarthrobacter sp. NPDC090522 TaxID=3364383 RepID=UPI0038214D80
MKSFVAQALILASPTAVWDVLTDTGNFAVWNSGITAVSGELRHGSTIHVRTQRSGKKTLRFRVTMVMGSSIVWSRQLPLGFGKITRAVTLVAQSGFTNVRVTETATGFASVETRSDTNHILRTFVEAVKFRAELLDHHLSDGVLSISDAPSRHG